MADGQQTASTKQAAAPEVEAKPMTLSQKLAAIRADSFGIGKDNIDMSYFDKKTNERKKFTIKGHTVEAVLSEMRPLFDSVGVICFPNLRERTYTGNRCDVLVDFEWENLAEPFDKRTVCWAGAGCDDGDKGFSKAGTNALKEHLKKLFLITDRDDAKEEEDKVEHKTDDGVRRGDMEKVKDQRKAAIRQWATAFKSSVENAKTEKEIDRIYRENSDQLDADDLEPVTKEFFAELRVTAKGRLLTADAGARG